LAGLENPAYREATEVAPTHKKPRNFFCEVPTILRKLESENFENLSVVMSLRAQAKQSPLNSLDCFVALRRAPRNDEIKRRSYVVSRNEFW
jgi:hypothetical protein